MNALSDQPSQTLKSVGQRQTLIYVMQAWPLINHFDLLFPQNCRAIQGITCLTEAYGAWERDSLNSWRRQPTATLLSTSKTPRHFIWLISATWKSSMTAYNPYLCIQQRWCTEDQTMSYPDDPSLSRQTPASSLVDTRLRPPCHCPLGSHGFLHYKWLWLRLRA